MTKALLYAIAIGAIMGVMGVASGDSVRAHGPYPTATPAMGWMGGLTAEVPFGIYSTPMPAGVRVRVLTSADCEQIVVVEGADADLALMSQKIGALMQRLIAKDLAGGATLSPDERKRLWLYRPGGIVDLTLRLPSGDYLRRGYAPAAPSLAGARAAYEECAGVDLDEGIKRSDRTLRLLKG